MKLYRTRTQEEYDWLMQKLEDEGCKWIGGDKPTNNKDARAYANEVVVYLDSDKILTWNFVRDVESKRLKKIIEVSDLMKQHPLATKVEERNNKPEPYTPPNTGDPWIDNLPESYFEMYEEDDAIKPQHYRKGEIDLYESWYRTYPFNEFRAGMQMIAERYMRRDKNDRIEDLEKARYTLERLKEYEVQHERD